MHKSTSVMDPSVTDAQLWPVCLGESTGFFLLFKGVMCKNRKFN